MKILIIFAVVLGLAACGKRTGGATPPPPQAEEVNLKDPCISKTIKVKDYFNGVYGLTLSLYETGDYSAYMNGVTEYGKWQEEGVGTANYRIEVKGSGYIRVYSGGSLLFLNNAMTIDLRSYPEKEFVMQRHHAVYQHICKAQYEKEINEGKK